MNHSEFRQRTLEEIKQNLEFSFRKFEKSFTFKIHDIDWETQLTEAILYYNDRNYKLAAKKLFEIIWGFQSALENNKHEKDKIFLIVRELLYVIEKHSGPKQ